jgi:hypothetical protein
MAADDDRKLADADRRAFLKKLSALTSGVVASTYVSPQIAMAQAGGGVSGGAMIPGVIVQSLFNYIATQGSPDTVVLWCVTYGPLSQPTAIFTYDTLRAATTVAALNEFLNGTGPLPGMPPDHQPMVDEARAAFRAAAVRASTKSKWPWE